MTLAFRRTLYIITIIVFLVLIPVIIAYGIGFHFDFSLRTLGRTGGLYINTFPKNVLVFVNGEKESSKAPAQIRYMKPGTYDVQLTSDGFAPAGFTTEIHEGVVVTIDKFELERIVPSSSSMYPASKIFASPFSDTAILIPTEVKPVIPIVLTSSTKSECRSIGETPENATWNPLANQVLLSGKTTTWLIQTNPCKIISSFDRSEFGSLSFTYDDRVLHSSLNQSSGILDASLAKPTRITTEQQAFSVAKKGVPLVTGKFESQGVAIYLQGGNDPIGLIPDFISYELIDDAHILITSSQGVYILDVKNRRLAYFDLSLTTFAYRNTLLVYTDGFEVYTLNTDKLEKTYLSRFSLPVRSLAFSPKENSLYITFDSSYIFWHLNISPNLYESHSIEGSSQILYQYLNTTSVRRFTTRQQKVQVEDFSL